MSDIKLPYLHIYRDRHGKARSFYRRVEHRGGPRVSVPIKGELGSRKWHDDYARIHAGFEGEKKRTVRSPELISDIIPRWLSTLGDKAPSTQEHYRKVAKTLDKIIGDQKVTSFKVREVYDLQEAIAEAKSPATAERCTTILSLIFKYARRRGLIDTNPAEGIDKPVGYKVEPYRSWSDDEINLALAKAPDHIVRAIMVLLFTGLRVSDAVRLQWKTHVSDDGFITIKTEKTDTEVCVPIADELTQELAKPRRGLFVLLSQTGRQYSARRVSCDIRTNMRRLGIASPPPPHGLRKNAVMKLIEDGNSYETIHAITGQSMEMIQHYGQRFERKKLAMVAVIKPRFGAGDEG